MSLIGKIAGEELDHRCFFAAVELCAAANHIIDEDGPIAGLCHLFGAV